MTYKMVKIEGIQRFEKLCNEASKNHWNLHSWVRDGFDYIAVFTNDVRYGYGAAQEFPPFPSI